MSELRAHYFQKVKDNPHYEHPLPQICVTTEEEEGTQEHTCELRDANGHTCGRIFDNRQKLAVHQAKAKGGQHGYINMATAICTSNQCVFCMNIYSDKRTCRNHMITALNRMQCPDPDRTHALHVLVPPKYNTCPLCEEVFQDFCMMQIHIRTHVPQLPSFLEPAPPSTPQISSAFSERLRLEFRARRSRL